MSEYIKSYLLLISILWVLSCNSGNNNKKGQTKTTKIDEISTIEKSLMTQGLINLQNLDTLIMVDLKYSTNDNFFKKDVYGSLTNAYLQKEPAVALAKANVELINLFPNYRLLIYDAVRPHHIQKILWDALDSIPPKKRKDFVADPVETSIHNYGCAVDLTIYDISTKQALDMGTPYDFFGTLAYPRLETEMLNSGKLNQNQLKNRKILRNVMIHHGFEPITSEWWHFNFYSRAKAKQIYKIIE